MIPKGLKVGDTFLEGKLVYKVTEVIGDRYRAEWTGATSSAAPVNEQPKETKKEEAKKEVKEEKPDYMSMPYAALKKMCAEKGLDAKGSKADLIARLDK